MRFNKLHILTLSVALAACAQADENAGAAADTTGDTLAARTDSAMEMPTEPTVIDLDDVNDSGISGEATATHSQQEATVTIVLKDGAKPDVDYPAHIHTGTCKDGGPVAVELGTVRNLQSSKTISLASLPADQPAFVQVHGPDGKPVACGDMKGHEGDDRGMQRDTAASTGTH